MRKRRPNAISGRWWNAFVEEYFRGRVLSVRGEDAPPWRHPWWTDLRWSHEAEQWVARATPGYCVSAEGADPQVEIPARFASAETRERLGLSGDETTTCEARLSERPGIPLPTSRWRAIGTDAVETTGSPGEAVPARFAARGVMGATVLDSGGEGGLVTRLSGLATDRAEARLLRACDLVLTHDRQRATAAVDLSASAVDVVFSSSAPARRGPWLEVRRKHEIEPPPGAMDMIVGGSADVGRDSLRLATLYLLSEPGAEPGAEPDATWEPSVVHRQKWNLQYRSRRQEMIVAPTRIAVPVPILGLGALGARAQPIVDEINRRAAEMEEALAARRSEGVFSLA